MIEDYDEMDYEAIWNQNLEDCPSSLWVLVWCDKAKDILLAIHIRNEGWWSVGWNGRKKCYPTRWAFKPNFPKPELLALGIDVK